MTVEMEKAPLRVPCVQKPSRAANGFYIFHQLQTLRAHPANLAAQGR